MKNLGMWLPTPPSTAYSESAALGEGFFFSVTTHVDLGYDNSKPFEDYLKKQGLDEASEITGLKLRETHRIVPHVRASSVTSRICRLTSTEIWAAPSLRISRSVGN